jgi:hypothetical protein
MMGCTTIYKLHNKTEIEANSISINGLTEEIKDDPHLFISKISLDTNHLDHNIVLLGFDFSLESGAFHYNDKIYFWLEIIRKKDSIISFTAEPFHWATGGPTAAEVYNSIYKKAGWKINKSGFVIKTYNYKATTLPLTIDFSFNQKNTESIDSLMTPFTDYIYPSECLEKTFYRILPYLNNDDLQLLLHCINPVTRAIVIKYILCSGNKFTSKIDNWVEYLINTSPTLRTIYGSFISYRTLSSLVKCGK